MANAKGFMTLALLVAILPYAIWWQNHSAVLIFCVELVLQFPDWHRYCMWLIFPIFKIIYAEILFVKGLLLMGTII
jgi:hypothetical protein